MGVFDGLRLLAGGPGLVDDVKPQRRGCPRSLAFGDRGAGVELPVAAGGPLITVSGTVPRSSWR
jgi:hypothetical protein